MEHDFSLVLFGSFDPRRGSFLPSLCFLIEYNKAIFHPHPVDRVLNKSLGRDWKVTSYRSKMGQRSRVNLF